jgi:hypothetical protein
MPEPIPVHQSQTPTNPSQRTRLGSKWLAKTMIFLIILLAFGCWGLWDATVVYPKRGIEFAERAKLQYLAACQGAGSIFGASIADPVSTYARVKEPETLRANRAAAQDPGNPAQARALAEERLYEWLDGLDTIGRLTPEFTRIEQPDKELERLDAIWKTRGQPKPLAKWDLPVQWLFVIVGIGGGLALAFLVLRVKSRTYGWEPAEQRLFLADGSSLVPADIAEFDKRKWDKFLIFLKVKPGHRPNGGREIRLDLLRYVPLEEWVLAMERTAYPEHAPPPTQEPPPAAA